MTGALVNPDATSRSHSETTITREANRSTSRSATFGSGKPRAALGIWWTSAA